MAKQKNEIDFILTSDSRRVEDTEVVIRSKLVITD